ncbi:hemagglutinin repeat-containing protein, partial [Snodgrassella communis]
ISISAGKQINIRQSDIDSLNGSINLYGKESVNIIEGRKTADLDESFYHKSSNIISSQSNLDKYQANHNEAVASNITGAKINISSDKDINIRGSNIIAQDQTILSAGRDINIQAAHNNYQDHQYHEEKKSGFTAGVSKGVASVGYSKSKSQLDQQDSNHTLTLSQIGSLKGNTIIQADGDLNASAAILGAGKDLTLQGKNINLLADHITSDQHIDLKTKQSGFSVGITYSPLIAAASTFKDGMRSGDFSNSIVGKNMQAGEAASSAVQAANTPVVITMNHQRSHQTQDTHNSQAVTTQASAGGNLNIIATDGSINSEGARLTAEGNALLHAKDSINLGFARDSHNQSATSKSSGFNLDTRKWSSPIGAAHQKGQGQGNLDSALGTQLSVGGNSVIQTSSGDINIIGSSVVAGGNNTINAARNINIRSSQNSISQSENHSSKGWGSAQLSDTEKFTGYMSSKDQYNSNNVEQIRSQIGSLNGNINIIAGEHYTQQVADIIAANNLNIIAKDITILDDANHGSAHQSSKDLKIGNFTKVSSPLIDLANAVDTLNQSKADDRTKALQTMAALGQGYTAYSAGKNIQDASLIKIESGIGFKSSKSQQDSSYRQSQANQLTAGGNINLISREGDIRLQNTQVNAQDSINLNSARDIILQAGQNLHKADGKNSSAGLSVGVGASIGAQTGVYIYGEAGFSSGNNHLNAQTHSQTTLQSDKLSLTSKGNTTLIGAQANANRIDANIGGKLSIISPQDQIDQKISQSGANIHVQGGFGSVWEASGGVNSSNASGHLNAVNQQSGLFAGKDGYHISADSIDLQGGAIASTAAKEHNQLTTNSLTFTDIENHSSFKASNTTISGGFSGKDSTIPGNPSYNPTLPQHQSGSDHSTTHATISPGQITINGKQTSVEELGIHSDIDSAHSQINQLPDLQQIMDKQQAVADATATIANSVRTLSADMARKANQERQQAREKAEQELQSNNPELWQDYNQLSEDKKQLVLRETSKDYRTADEQAQSWGIGGGKSRALNAVTSAVTGILGGQTNLQAATNALAPYAAELIGKQFGHGDNQNQAAQLVAHALLGAISASINGGNAA